MDIELTDYWKNVSSGIINNQEFVHIIGFTDASTTLKTIWSQSGLYVYPQGTKLKVSSSDINDVNLGTGAWKIGIEGLDPSFNKIYEEVILNGQTPVETTKLFKRVFSAYVLTGVETKGTIYIGSGTVTSGVPSVINMIISPIYNQSKACIYTIPDEYDGYITNLTVTCYGVNSKINAYIAARDCSINNTVFRTLAGLNMNGGTFAKEYKAPIKITSKVDIEIRCKSDQTNDPITASFGLLLIRKDN